MKNMKEIQQSNWLWGAGGGVGCNDFGDYDDGLVMVMIRQSLWKVQ